MSDEGTATEGDRAWLSWAVWDEDLGLIVFDERCDALEALAGCGRIAKVVPIKIIIEATNDWDRRHRQEDDFERAVSVAKSWGEKRGAE